MSAKNFHKQQQQQNGTKYNFTTERSIRFFRNHYISKLNDCLKPKDIVRHSGVNTSILEKYTKEHEAQRRKSYSCPKTEIYTKSCRLRTKCCINIRKKERYLYILQASTILLLVQYASSLVSPVLPWTFNAGHYLHQLDLSKSLYENLTNPSSQIVSLIDDGSPMSGWTRGIFSGILSKDMLDEHIKKLLVPRVSGSQGLENVKNYIVQYLEGLGYHTELDEFIDSTPIGRINFSNIVATSDPDACRQLVLACHYDSKMMDDFLGATDSAVPCAMLLELSRSFNTSFRPPESSKPKQANNRLALTFIFFDGEEAFIEWSATDSLYGSRHLAAVWEKKPAPSQCDLKNELARIELFVLLDLIGTSDTTFAMYNRKLRQHYNDLQKFDREYLMEKKMLSASQAKAESLFRNRYIPLDLLQDDHVPFHKRKVPVLSLLAHPFPAVWHSPDDNYEAIDFDRTRRILYVIERFVSKFIH